MLDAKKKVEMGLREANINSSEDLTGRWNLDPRPRDGQRAHFLVGRE